MPDRRSSERHLEMSDADERVVDLDEPQDVVPLTDDGEPGVVPDPPPDPLTE